MSSEQPALPLPAQLCCCWSSRVVFVLYCASFSGANLAAALVSAAFFCVAGLQLKLGLPFALALLLPILDLRLALSLLLILLPVFGSRPGAPQTNLLLFIGCGLQLGIALSLLRREMRRRFAAALAGRPLLVLSALYLLASALSLCSLPWRELLDDIRSSVLGWSEYDLVLYKLYAFATATEDKLAYSIVSVFWTSLAVNFAFACHASSLAKPRYALQYASSIMAGLLFSLAAGFLDYYQVIDLRKWRPLDPVVNPGNVQFRLQSFFAHSGWFAEYLTLSIPYVLTILALKIRFWKRAAIIISILVVGEVALILTFQRGGWLSYPLTLFVVWTAIYTTYRLEQKQSVFFAVFKASLGKVLFSLPVTIAASLVIIWFCTATGLFHGPSELDLSRYLDRAKDISRASDRTDFVRAGFMLGLLNPFLGAGSESFAFNFRREFNTPQGRYYRRINLPLHGSAHNVYMQTFAGKGAAGLALLLALVLCSIVRPVSAVLNNHTLNHKDRVVLLAGACFGSAFLIYGNVQEIFYVQPLQYLFFTGIALSAACLPERKMLGDKPTLALLCFLVAMAICQAAWNARRSRFISGEIPSFGCFAEERDPAGRIFRWCSTRARQQFPLNPASVLPTRALPHGEGRQDSFSFTLLVEIGPRPRKESTFRVSLDGNLLKEFKAKPSARYRLELQVPPHLIGNIQGQSALLDLESDGYFIPKRDMPPSEDLRILSYKLLAAETQPPG